MRNVDAESDGFGSQVIEFSLFHGWPCCVIAQRTARIDGPNVFKTEINKIWGEFSIASAIIDLTVALLFLASVWFLCEWLIRRSAARKEA